MAPDKDKLKTAQDYYALGLFLRRNSQFGEAINAFRKAASMEDADQELIDKCQASIDLMQEINGFVNTDLMNP